MEKLLISFKTEKPKGRYKSFNSPTHHIKVNKMICGLILDDKPFKIRLMVVKKDIMEDNNPNCTWKWITLGKKSDSLQEAKDFLTTAVYAICEKFTLHFEK